jgi:hypothetical protein
MAGPHTIGLSQGVVDFDSDNHRTIVDLLDDGDRLTHSIKRSKFRGDDEAIPGYR